MARPFILHMFTPLAAVSPFDVNMAHDAGYQAVMPYTGVRLEDVPGLTLDAIFSRGPNGIRRTAIFIGGRDIGLACDMVEAARRAMVPPFELSVFADPAGAFTTAAALLASVEVQLTRQHASGLDGCRVLLLGGTGPVGSAAAVLASSAGARVNVVSHLSLARARAATQALQAGASATLAPADASDIATTLGRLADADVILGTAKAGVQVLGFDLQMHCRCLKVAADLNAVPPAGIEGVGPLDQGTVLRAGSGSAVGIGALAIGNLKYQVMRDLFGRMLEGSRPACLDLRDALASARRLVAAESRSFTGGAAAPGSAAAAATLGG